MRDESSNEKTDSSFENVLTQANHLTVEGGIRLSINIANTDIGFETLYHELSKYESPTARSKLVKRILFDAHQGIEIAIWNGINDYSPAQHHSFKIAFSLSSRAVGLEWLFKRLEVMASAFEKNQHVRRLLYQAFVLETIQAKSVAPKSPISITFKTDGNVGDKASSVGPSTGKKLTPLTDGQLAARNEMRAQKHKQNAQNYQ